MVLHRFWDDLFAAPFRQLCIVGGICVYGRSVYVCKKTNGFELINLGKFDFSAGQHVEFSKQQQQCHGIESRLVVPALRAENRAPHTLLLPLA